jgi:hypothetical protein
MSKLFKRWIYHKTNKPMIINSDEFEDYEKKGWADTPAKFAKIKDFGIDENDAAAVQVLGEALDGVKDRLNDELNFNVMKKVQLEDYAKRHFNVDLDRRRSLKKLRAEVRKLASN